MNRRQLLKGIPAALAASAPVSLAAPAKKARLRSAICAYSYRDALKAKTMTYDDVVRAAVENGVDGLDLTVYWFPDTSNEFLLPLKRLAYKSGVDIYSISVSTEMTQSTAALREKQVTDLRKWIDAAEKLGAGHIRVFGGRIPKDANEDQAAGWVAEVLKRSAEYAAQRGVILGLENHGGITEKADTIIRIVKQVDSPWVGINLDTGNFNRDGYAQAEKCVPWAANVQVKTEVRDAAGKPGPSDWDRFAKILVNGGYQGYLALEYEAKEDPATAMPRMLKRLNEICKRNSA